MPRKNQFLTGHRLFAVVLAVATALRVVTMLGFRPAELFNDSYLYLLLSLELIPPTGFRSIGYPLLLRLLQPFHSVAVIVAVQHLLGLAVGATIYATLRRRSLPAWGATLAAAPALLDASFLALEHTILTETLFTFLVVAATTILLWSRTLSVKAASVSGLLLAWAALTRSVGVPLLALVLVHSAVRQVGWRQFAALALTGTLPLAAYATWYNAYYGRFALSGVDGIALWARTMTFADCNLIRPPPQLLPLCPNGLRLDAASDYVWHHGSSLNQMPRGPVPKNQLARDFARLAIAGQPLDYLGEIAKDTSLAFHWTREVHPEGGIPALDFRLGQFSLRPGYPVLARIRREYDPALIDIRSVEPYAGFIVEYQGIARLRGPLLAAILLLGGLGSLGRRRAALLPWGIAAVLLVVPVAVLDFDHRYVLPVVPVACLAAALAIADLRRR